ncbi:hypothetical protein P7H46_13725, partial [Enterococcus pseudoavium]
LFFRQACLLKFASLMYLNFISFASIQPIMSSNTFRSCITMWLEKGEVSLSPFIPFGLCRFALRKRQLPIL